MLPTTNACFLLTEPAGENPIVQEQEQEPAGENFLLHGCSVAQNDFYFLYGGSTFCVATTVYKH